MVKPPNTIDNVVLVLLLLITGFFSVIRRITTHGAEYTSRIETPHGRN